MLHGWSWTYLLQDLFSDESEHFVCVKDFYVGQLLELDFFVFRDFLLREGNVGRSILNAKGIYVMGEVD